MWVEIKQDDFKFGILCTRVFLTVVMAIKILFRL